MNSRERSQWVMNDEGLYNWWKSSRVSLTAFIRENREELDRVIAAALNRGPSRNPGHPPRRGKGGKLIYTLPKPSLASLFPPEGMQAERIRAIRMGTALDEKPSRRAGGGLSRYATHPAFRKNAPVKVAITVKEGEATYGWIITRDHLFESDPEFYSEGEEPGYKGRVDLAGPRNINDEVWARLRKGEGRLFKMYDDDGELYYTGRFIGDDSSEEGFGPLDDFGTPDSGAVRIDYRQDSGKWETL